MKNLETGLDYVKFDESVVRQHQYHYRHEPNWQGAWIYCLKYNDEESAHLIRLRNDEAYREDYEQRTAQRFEHPQLKSLRECESERVEALDGSRAA